MTRPFRVAQALLRGASAFFSALNRRPPEAVSTEVVPDEPRVPLGFGLRSGGVENRCPVCQARFRGSRICSRCGADLEPLMVLTVKAWQLRQAARQALDTGDAERASGLALKAQSIQGTGSGEALRLLCAWLSGNGSAQMLENSDFHFIDARNL